MVRPGATWDRLPGYSCVQCGEPIIRQSYASRDESPHAYKLRRYCTMRCQRDAVMEHERSRRFRADGFVLCVACDEFKPRDAYACDTTGKRKRFPSYCQECQANRDAARPSRQRKETPIVFDRTQYAFPGTSRPAAALRKLATKLLAAGLGFAFDVLMTIPENTAGAATPYFKSPLRAKLWDEVMTAHAENRTWT